MHGAHILSLAAQHIGEKYVLGIVVPKDVKSYTGPWDCAEFGTWLVYQVTGKLYGCANNEGDPNGADAYSGFWVRDARKLGRIITVEEAAKTPGAAVVRIAGKGLIGHLAISDGLGGTVEAHSSRTGVMRNKISGRRWDMGVLIPELIYTQTTAAPAVPIKKPAVLIYRWKTPMMFSESIKNIQRAVGLTGKNVDGWYGSKTHNAVKAYQVKMGLVPDGEVGPETAAHLEAYLP